MILRIRRSMEERDEGFTLIELLVVVIIIGILAAIAIPIFLNQRKSAVTAGVESDVRNIATNVETAATAANGVYPANAAVDTASDPMDIAGNDVYRSDDGSVFEYNQVSDTAFTVCGYNPNSNAPDDTEAVVYSSAAGGLQTGFAACP